MSSELLDYRLSAKKFVVAYSPMRKPFFQQGETHKLQLIY